MKRNPQLLKDEAVFIKVFFRIFLNGLLFLSITIYTGCSSLGNKAEGKADTVVPSDVQAPPAEVEKKDVEKPVDVDSAELPNSPDLSAEFGGRDPIEGFNRSMFAVDKFALRYIIQPITVFWGSLIPRHGIECFNRFTENVAFPKRTFSSLLQAKFKYAGIDTSRFLINITLGIAGFYDPALNWFDMEIQDEDFGQAFAVWGIGSGVVIHIPCIGPSNIRDGVGKIFDYAFDPKTYIWGGQGFTMLNQSTSGYREMDVFLSANNDPYELLKKFYAVQRYFKINDLDRREIMDEYQKKLMEEEKEAPLPEADPILNQIVIRGFTSQGPYIDTLRIGMVDVQNDHKSMWVDVSLWNSDFFNQGSIRSVKVIEGKPGMPYKVWYQKRKDAPLAIVLPGAGSHYTSNDNSAISEILFNRGFTVVAMSNVLNWEFMATAASVAVPGYTPADASDVRNAIAAVLKDLEENKDLSFPEKILVGWSSGGMHALFIGDMEKKDPVLKISRYVAINPPVDLENTMKESDKLGIAWKKWGEKRVFERGSVALMKYLGLSKKFYKPYEEPEIAQGKKEENGKDKGSDDLKPLPFTGTEAKSLVYYNFKVTLEDVVLSIVRNNENMNYFKNKCTWGNRTDFYHEINQLTFAEFTKMYILKYRSEIEGRKMTIEELNKKSSLAAIEDFLRNDKNVCVIHSANDFLESSSNRRWLKETMGDRCIFYNVGGHLGNLYLARLQKSLEYVADGIKEP
ncbi:MAG: VacJ family lipoprotein [Victivallales bacterium]